MTNHSPATVLLIPGAFARSTCYDDDLVPELNNRGHPTAVAPIPSSTTQEPRHATCADDNASISSLYIHQLVQVEHKDIVLFVHSYSGALTCGAVDEDICKLQRAKKGLKGGVIGLVYLAGVVLKQSQSLFDAIGGQWPPYIKTDTPSADLSIMYPPFEQLFNDVDPSRKSELEASVIPHATAAFTTPPPKAAWESEQYSGRLLYIRTLRDAVFPQQVQDKFMEDSGVKWEVVDVEGSHNCFVSRPAEPADIISKHAQKWQT